MYTALGLTLRFGLDIRIADSGYPEGIECGPNPLMCGYLTQIHACWVSPADALISSPPKTCDHVLENLTRPGFIKDL